MMSINIAREFKTFAEAATWADDEIAKYLAQGYSVTSLTISSFEPLSDPFNVYIALEKHDA
jgi:hypothetical protein